MLLLLLLTEVAAVGVVFDNLLAHVIHSVHQELKALLQVVAGREMSDVTLVFGLTILGAADGSASLALLHLLHR